MLGSAAPARAPSTWRERTVAAALGCFLTALLTFPTVTRFATAGRLDTGDGRYSIWNVAWVAHAITTDPRHLFDANIFYPHPNALTFSELNLVAGVLASPVWMVTRNALAAHNSAVLMSLLIAFYAMWTLVRRLTASTTAGLVSATGYTFAAYTSAHTPEIQLLMIFGFPITMIALHQVVARQRWQDGCVLGLALATTALACGYYGVFAGAMVGVAAIIWTPMSRAYWVSLGCAVAVASVCVGPVLVPYLRARSAAGAVRTGDDNELRRYSANAKAYLTSGTRLDSRWLPALYPQGSPPFKEVLFPGVVISTLAAVGLVASWRSPARSVRRQVLGYAAVAIFGAWGSLGPDGWLYRVFEQVMPGASMLRAPSRMGIVVTFALAVLAGFGYRQLAGRRLVTCVGVLALLAVELWVPWPLQPMPATARAYDLLATLPRGGVVEFPFPYASPDFHSHTYAMLRSTRNWQPLLNGYSDFIPQDFYDLAMPITAFPDATSFAILKAHDVRYVVVRIGDYGTGEFRKNLLDRFPPYDQYLRKLTDEGDVWLYEITSWPRDTTVAASFTHAPAVVQ